MATKLTKKVKKHISDNVLVAVAITSLLFNLFFLVGVVIYNSSSKLDEALLNNAISRYCDDYTEVAKGDDGKVTSRVEFDITCQSGEFEPYFIQAVEDYKQDLGY